MESGILSKLAKLDSYLSHHIRGQNEIIPCIVSVLQRGELGLTKPGRPKGSFLFLGPTGVGKTEITLAFSRYLFGEESVHRFDMSEYQSPNDSVSLLLGGSAGEIGMLGHAFRRSSSGTLLFDEIEKAHPRVLDILLQVLDAARVTLANGETLDLSRFYIVLTSNIGSSEIVNLQHSSAATVERHVLGRAQQEMRPELYARIGERLVFRKLDYETQLEIAQLMLEQEVCFFASKGHFLNAESDVLSFLIRKGFHPRLGARPLRDAVGKYVGDAVAQSVLNGESGSGLLWVDGEVLRVSATLDQRATLQGGGSMQFAPEREQAGERKLL